MPPKRKASKTGGKKKPKASKAVVDGSQMQIEFLRMVCFAWMRVQL